MPISGVKEKLRENNGALTNVKFAQNLIEANLPQQPLSGEAGKIPDMIWKSAVE